MAKSLTHVQLLELIQDNLEVSDKRALGLNFKKGLAAIREQIPRGLWKNNIKCKIYNNEFNSNDEPKSTWKSYVDSAWIAGRQYDEVTMTLTVHFYWLTTNGKPPVMLMGVPKAFVMAFDTARSKGRFYLDNIALYKWVGGGENIRLVENRGAKFNAIDLQEILTFVKKIGENDLPPRILNSIKVGSRKFKSEMSDAGLLRESFLKVRGIKAKKEGRVINLGFEGKLFDTIFKKVITSKKEFNDKIINDSKEFEKFLETTQAHIRKK